MPSADVVHYDDADPVLESISMGSHEERLTGGDDTFLWAWSVIVDVAESRASATSRW